MALGAERGRGAADGARRRPGARHRRTAIGLLGSFALSRTIATFLYETSALDPLIYAAVTALLLAVTTLACLAPARRAARSDPMAALRHA